MEPQEAAVAAPVAEVGERVRPGSSAGGSGRGRPGLCLFRLSERHYKEGLLGARSPKAPIAHVPIFDACA